MTTPSKPSPTDRPWLPEGAIEKATLDPRTVLILHEGEGGMWTVAALASLVKLFPEMAAMLRELEWAGAEDYPDAGARKCCPLCRKFYLRPERGMPDALHTPDCRLASLLRELP